MKRLLVVTAVFFLALHIQGQDVDYARKVLHKLTGRSMHGRGYVKQGDQKAAAYIAGQFKKHGLASFGDDYYQTYSFPMNTLPGNTTVKLDDRKLKPGYDFVVSSSTPTVKGAYDLVFAPDSAYNDSTFALYLEKTTFNGGFLVVKGKLRKQYGKSIKGLNGVVLLTDKQPWWHVSNGDKVATTCWIKSKAEYFPETAKTITVDIETVYIPEYQTQNVIAYVKGKTQPDRFIAFTAHYDHLGMMGKKAYFPGANDNASGTSMVLDLAAYYSKPENQPDKSVVFMLFSGEEAGLKGSTYYTEHPLFPLEEIDFLVNLDMVGTGSEGITVVNTEAYNDVLEAFRKINKDQQYNIKEIKRRGEACNSDHCPFYKTGVKSIFIYTRGPEHTAYHSVYDTGRNFPFTVYDGLFRLLTDYVKTIQ